MSDHIGKTFVERPTVGRIVHYMVEGIEGPMAHRAAIVTEVGADTIDLTVFGPGGVHDVDDVHEDPACRPETWHWPERA